MKSTGYEEQYLDEIEKFREAYEDARVENEDLRQHLATTIFNSEENENLVKWQLDIKEELVRIEHLLKKHVPKRDKQGNEYFEEPSEENKLFNDWGVNEILHILAWYLCKNIILSNFKEDDIKIRCEQFGGELTDFIFNNYEQMGLNDKDKIKHFPMVVMNIVNTVEAAYNRALNGGERESLRTARHVSQTQPIGGYGNQSMQQMQPQNKFRLTKPTTWFGR